MIRSSALPRALAQRVQLVATVWISRASGALRLGGREVLVHAGGLVNPFDASTLTDALRSGEIQFVRGETLGYGDVVTLGLCLLDVARDLAPVTRGTRWERIGAFDRERLVGLGLAPGAEALLEGVFAERVQLVVGAEGWNEALADLSALEILGLVRALGDWEFEFPDEDPIESAPAQALGRSRDRHELDSSDEFMLVRALDALRAGQDLRALARLRAAHEARVNSPRLLAWLGWLEACQLAGGAAQDRGPARRLTLASSLDPEDPEIRLLSLAVQRIYQQNLPSGVPLS